MISRHAAKVEMMESVWREIFDSGETAANRICARLERDLYEEWLERSADIWFDRCEGEVSAWMALADQKQAAKEAEEFRAMVAAKKDLYESIYGPPVVGPEDAA